MSNMDQTGTPASSMDSTGDTSRLLKELMDLQKTAASSMASIDRSLTLQESQENVVESTGMSGAITGTGAISGTGDATDPTLTELMKTMYDGANQRQLITLQGSDTANSFSVYGQEVDIVSSKQETDPGQSTMTSSNKVKITPVVKYDWESRRYVGNIVAVHRNSSYAAYVLKGKTGGVVRVINRTRAERSLLKDFVGRVIDLAFAHTDDVHLAVVDEIGNLYIYNIILSKEASILCSLILHIVRPEGTLVSEYHRVIWCPYIPDDCDDSSVTESSMSDFGRMLVLTNDEKAEIWSVDMVLKDHHSGQVSADSVEMGLIKIDSCSKPITDAAFSPDGTALATASLDGEVKFFQVYMHGDTSPRCLHQWKPHGGKPMSCLFFLDDHKNIDSDFQFWKFAVTGANNNQEIKIWSCESWSCLQTIRFLCPPGLPSNFSIEPCMKAAIDLSAKHLILSDIKRKVLYVLQLHQDSTTNTAHVSSVSEFILAQPCLSFAILDAGTKRFAKTTGDDSHLDEITTGEIDQDQEERDEARQRSSEEKSRLGIQIKLYTVHPKALQELLIRFRPESSAPPPAAPSLSSISQGESGVMDPLSDISMSVDGFDSEDKSDKSFSGKDTNGYPILLTPDAFTSSPRKSYPEDSLVDNVRGSASSTSSFTNVTGTNNDFLSPRSSSSSTITQTPTTPTKPDPQTQGVPDTELTPTSLPLPPSTAKEESELATPTSSTGRESLQGDETPTKGTIRDAVDEFFTPTKPRTELSQVSLDSTSDSTGLFDVSELRIQKPQASYDEDDEEVAVVMGESVTDSYDEVVPEGTQPFVEQTEGEGEREPTEDGGNTQESLGNVLGAWPKPPNVNNQAQLIAAEGTEVNTQDDEDVKIIEETEDEIGEEDEEEIEEELEGEEEENGEEDREDHKEEEEEEDMQEETEDVEEEEEPEQSDESMDSKPKVAPVAGSGFSSPRDSRRVEIREIHKEIVREVMDKKELGRLHVSIEQVLNTLISQQHQLDQLKQDMSSQQENYFEAQRIHLEQEQLRQVPQDSQVSIEEHLSKLENMVTSRVERLFTQHSQRESQRVQELLRLSESREQQKHERLTTSLTQAVNSAVVTNIERSVRTEFKNTVVPSVTRVLEPVKEQIHQELAQKLTATDSLLKDNISKMVRSRQTIDAIGMAAGVAIQTPIQAAYRETFQNIVVPSFERATHNMCQQVSDVMSKGTKEYMQHLESHLERIRQQHLDVRDPLVSELRKLTDTFKSSAEEMRNHTLSVIQNQLTTQVQTAMAGIQENTLRYVREAVREEVSTAVKEQGNTISDSLINAMRSGAVTPIQVTPDPQVEITHVMNLLRQGQLNASFQQALSASNLDLVMMVCETVNPSQVFNQTPCPLQQPVLLSLIQQLSADLANKTELKHKYLEEAVMNLDLHDQVTQEHLKPVLTGLIQKLTLHMEAHPNDKTTRALRMLKMAAQSLLR